MLKDYLNRLKNYRSNECINTIWKSPDLQGCVFYGITEIGEATDCLVSILRPDDHRNNPQDKHTEVAKELQDVAMMVASAILTLDINLDYFTYANNDPYKHLDKLNIRWFNALIQQMAVMVDQFRLYELQNGEMYKWGIISSGVRIIQLCANHCDLLAEQEQFFIRKTAKILKHNNFIIIDGIVTITDELAKDMQSWDKLSDESLHNFEAKIDNDKWDKLVDEELEQNQDLYKKLSNI